MNNEKLNNISNLFNNNEIRSIWDEEKEAYYFSVVDVIKALTDSKDPSDYWTTLKRRLLSDEQSELPTKCRKLKMISKKDGKKYLTETLETKNIFRLIESVHSPNAEPFKIRLANLGSERIDEIYDPELAMNRTINYYRNKGYHDDWIEARIKGIISRNKLTNSWKNHGINESFEFAILTNELYKSWSSMTAAEYKSYKNIRKESLRDNMTDIEIALADIVEITTRELIRKRKPIGLKENIATAKTGGKAAKIAKTYIEKELEESIITKSNNLNIKYIDNNK